uniref:BPTI/Kunitz inhibitor domain-containing protein n=1 Tax=Varanus komodoensis TaxID=61221 RepID=A0A8D2IVZ4_VARKO
MSLVQRSWKIVLAASPFFSICLWNSSDLATCEQPRDRGPCTESFPRFYYDAHSKNCSAFDFGSCNGNRNNFMTIEDLEWCLMFLPEKADRLPS